MLNKKRIGLGMLVAGGAVAIAGAIITRKGIKESKEVELTEELNSPCGMEISCDDCGYCDHYENPDNFKEVATEESVEIEMPVEELVATPVVEEVAVAEEEKEEETTPKVSAYNPMSEPSSMSQEDLEAFGLSTF